jgi:hypothetical protein
MDLRPAVIERLQKAGCHKLEDIDDAKELWASPITGCRFVVELAIKSRVTANRILQNAGLPIIT